MTQIDDTTRERLLDLLVELERTLKKASKFGQHDTMRTYVLAGYLKDNGENLQETLQEILGPPQD